MKGIKICNVLKKESDTMFKNLDDVEEYAKRNKFGYKRMKGKVIVKQEDGSFLEYYESKEEMGK